MNCRVFLLYLCVLASAASAFAAEPRPRPRPNILLLSVDDMNDWLGCLGGYPGVGTPNIDRLAKRGVLFANAHCASPALSARSLNLEDVS